MGKFPCWTSSAFALPLLSLLTVMSAAAQDRAAVAAAPGTAAAALGYGSAFEGYQRFDDEPVRSWKDSNATVERIGGWRAYARQAQAPASQPAAAARAAEPHEGHSRP
ncbi:MAG: hypothetical protein Q8N17_08845 [Burkholderiaceae bacterium]|nr:hypothetical protein [Burkholderiaceae bacterium]